MSSANSWRDVPPGTVAWGGTSREVQTGLWRSMRPVLDVSRCVSCLRCWVQCPDDSISTDENARVTGIDLFYCKGCGICKALCPVNAIELKPESDFSGQGGEPGEDPGRVGEFIG